jgi:hypothetical protein
MNRIKTILANIGFWLFTILIAPFFLLWQFVSVVWSGVWTLIAGFFVMALFGATIEEALAGASVMVIFVTVIAKLISDRNKQ